VNDEAVSTLADDIPIVFLSLIKVNL